MFFKRFFKLIFVILLLILSCSKDEEKSSDIYIGKLVKKGICLNYVIEVNDNEFPQSLIEKKWIDEFSNIEFKNVFTLESVCDFPTTLNQGDTFKFKIGNNSKNICAVCKAYTPVPNKYISITVIE